MKFFVIDDDPDMIELVTALLEAAGHSVSSSLAGTDAIPRIASRIPDCVLTDLMMAELDGLQLCRELRARADLSGIRIVIVSARTHDYWRERAREAGADGYVTKPLDPAAFVGQVVDIIGD
jgi:Response regulators consisting of a CheY-like receiver domain and a winged-helix DNA-binding domain